MASANARRIARLEARRAAVVPNVVEVRTGETLGEALARFAERHGRLPSAFIATPTRATDDELSDLEPLWADQQRRLVADARDATRKLKEGNDDGKCEFGTDGRDAGIYAGSRSKGRRICSAPNAGHTVGRDAWKPRALRK